MYPHLAAPPSREDIVTLVGRLMYQQRILNNTHRGNVVEAMVLAALGPDWKLVGLGWHPWDLERGSGSSRIRIQVKQWAALQLWTPKKPGRPKVTLGSKEKPPGYFSRDNPGVNIEPEGWFCDLFVIGIHRESDRDRADQVDPAQWQFLVIPTCDLQPRQNTLDLDAARASNRWPVVSWSELSEAVKRATS